MDAIEQKKKNKVNLETLKSEVHPQLSHIGN